MIIKKHKWLLAVLSACLAPATGLAGRVGDPAEPLRVKEWIKGGPVDVKAGTNIFVVEVFGTASLASRASITNLNAIQKRFQDQGVVVVGVSDEPAERIKKFVQREGAKIEYAIAADDERHTTQAYMVPVRQRGIPCAFIVGKDGKLLWHGHPLAGGLAEALGQIVAGSYDLEQARKADIARVQMAQYLAMATRGDVRTGQAGQTLLAARTNDPPLLCDLAFQIVTAPKLIRRDLAVATAALDQAEKLGSTNATHVATTRAILLFETGKKDEALVLARKALAAAQGAKEKTNAELFLRTMEARMQPATTNRIKSAATNQMAMVTTNRVKSATTNEIPGTSGNP
jgi:hypothetical protein